MLAHHEERAYLIREVDLRALGKKRRTYVGTELPKALKRYGKSLKRNGVVGSIVLRISAMSGGPNSQPAEAVTFAVISDTDGQLYLTLPR